MNLRPAYIWRVGDATSQFFNALLFAGDANESISGRSYRLSEQSAVWRTMYQFVNTLFFWQEDHCKHAHYQDVLRAGRLLRDYAEATDIVIVVDYEEDEIFAEGNPDV